MVSLSDITIRTELHPGDIGYIIYSHGILYSTEYNYGIDFEAYVAAGLSEFYCQYDPSTNRVWVCEYQEEIIGFLLLMNRGDAAQLRYFYIEPEFRGIGLGKTLMQLYMDFLTECNYQSSYLWTTKELDSAATLYQRYGFVLVEEKESIEFGKQTIEQRYVYSPKVTI